MYSYEERLRAVKLYIKYDHSLSAVIRELGYPSHQALLQWYREYITQGDLHVECVRHRRRCKFTMEQRKAAVAYYQEHGQNLARTVKKLGYPSRATLFNWLKEDIGRATHPCHSGAPVVKLQQDQKEQAVIDLCIRESSAEKIASKHGVSRASLYKWKDELLGREREPKMSEQFVIQSDDAEQSTENLRSEVARLKEKIAKLQQEAAKYEQEAFRARLQRDIYEKASELIKKEAGIDLDELTNKEKAILINALRGTYSLKILLSEIKIAKSSYCYQTNVLKAQDKYLALRSKIKTVFTEAYCSYGYRRIHAHLKNAGITVSEKIVRRIMQQEHLIVPYTTHKRKYSSYKGEISPEVDNLIQRDFSAERPNEKWLTDITEFSIPAGKVYLSPVIDCYDGIIVTWTIGTSPNAELVNTMLDNAIEQLSEDEHPIIHSDRGCHYRWPGWIERMNTAGLIRSMSKKGCSPDNSACEGVFGRLKNEMFYYVSWAGYSINQFINAVDQYLHWYCEKRIKLSLGGMSPLEYRQSKGIRTPNLSAE